MLLFRRHLAYPLRNPESAYGHYRERSSHVNPATLAGRPSWGRGSGTSLKRNLGIGLIKGVKLRWKERKLGLVEFMRMADVQR
jgi:hypothetical protein